MKVRYLAPKKDFQRTLRPMDFTAMGVPGIKENVVWNQTNHFVAEMAKAAGEKLVEKFPKEFATVKESGDEPEPETDTSDESSSNPDGESPESSSGESGEGVSDASLSDPSDEAASSTPKAKKKS